MAQALETLAHFGQGIFQAVAASKQLDDPDAPLWIVAYGSVALFSFAASFASRVVSEFWAAALTLAFVLFAWASQLFQQLTLEQQVFNRHYLETKLGQESLGLITAAFQMSLVALTLRRHRPHQHQSSAIATLFFSLLHLASLAVAVIGVIRALDRGSKFGLYQQMVAGDIPVREGPFFQPF